jgi:SAM-dependent methyltransferase
LSGSVAQAVTNAQARAFWERHPVGAEAVAAEPGTAAFFAAFDALREADECEPYAFSNRIHGYDRSSGKRVLDIGCGNGYVLSHYARYGATVHGIDLTQTALDLSRRRFELAGLAGDLRRTDGDAIPHPDGFFDVVCSMGVLHHIEDPRPMLREAARVLRPGGELVLMLYHRNSWKYRVVLPLRCVFDPRYRGKTLQQALNMNDGDACPLAKVYSRAELRPLLDGFADLRFTVNQLSWKQLLLVPPLARLLEPVLPPYSDSVFARRLGWNLYVNAVKPR